MKNGESPGFPRFRSRARGINSFDLPTPTIKRHRQYSVLSVKGIGKFRFKGCEVDGTIKMARVVRTPRRIVVQVVVDYGEVADASDHRSPLGIDVGIASRITLSDGFQSPKVEVDRSKLKRRQRILSRATKGSASRAKKRASLSRQWQRVREAERGTLHELTSSLVEERSSRFFVENLQIRNMVRNKRLARSIMEQQWGTFAQQLGYKAEEAGGFVRYVNPRNTSQLCSVCGFLPEIKLALSLRTYACGVCGHTEDRDVNAARNILSIGLADWSGGAPPACREDANGVGELNGSPTQDTSAVCMRAAQ